MQPYQSLLLKVIAYLTITYAFNLQQRYGYLT